MAFDPNEARDTGGRWTAGAGGDIPAAPDPRVATVAGGDIWNKDTAARLENEYAAARPALDKIATQAPEHEGEVEVTTEPSWDALSGTSQEKAEEAYKSNNYDSEYESEVSNWQESGEPQREAAQQLAEDDDWKAETLTDYLADRHGYGQPDIPYSADDLAKAITIEAADDYSGSKHNPDIGFDPQELQHPTDINPNFHPDQLAMPGITPPTDILENHLTPEMRADITTYFMNEFNDKVEKNAEKIDAPDHLSENVTESLESAWSEMGDEEKYEWTKNNTQLTEDLEAEQTTETGSLELPRKWDPLNEGSGSDYVKTQALAKYMADTRAAQVMAERGIGSGDRPAYKRDAEDRLTPEIETKSKAPVDISDIRAADAKLWEGWKGSSTGGEGKLIQVAAADELGGRLREAAPEKPDVTSAYKEFAGGDAATGGTLSEFHNAVIEAFNNVSDVGGFAAKLSADPDMSEEQKKVAHDALYERSQTAGGPPTLTTEAIYPTDETGRVSDTRGYTKLPGLDLQRNGAASFTTDAGVANGWGGTTNHSPQGIERQAVIDQANKDFKDVGGYDGVKAITRAKWETSQYMLDKADIPVVNLYRGITLSHRREGEDGGLLRGTVYENNVESAWQKIADHGVAGAKMSPEETAAIKQKYGSFSAMEKIVQSIADAKTPLEKGQVKIMSGVDHVPGIGLKGPEVAALQKEHGTVDAAMKLFGPKPVDIKSGPGNEPTRAAGPTYSRVVLRAEVPRTAVLSVPAFGQNIHSEHEVVITGTAWHNWDAYSDRAPRAEDVSIGKSNVIKGPGPTTDIDKLITKLAPHPDAGKVTIKLTPEQEDIVAKYKAKIPKEQQL